jgi:uncharacterized protein YifN (PemK superfamily)
MAIQFPVGPGTILLCDYSRGGFQPPEMTKRRPAVVVSPRLPHRDGLCAVVPLSGSESKYNVPYVVRLELTEPLPPPYPQKVWWAKCDMVATVSFQRLDFFRTARDWNHKRKYIHPVLSADDMKRVHTGVLMALGLGHLTLTNSEAH